MDDLIYNFLRQLDYPRASIVFDFDFLGELPKGGSGMKVPTFVIVDPDTAEPLAVIEVVDAIKTDNLSDIATQTGAYASRLAGAVIQGYVIRVNVSAKTENEQIQFYRIWPNSTLQQLSTKHFPDFDSLCVSRKLLSRSKVRALNAAASQIDSDSANGSFADPVAVPLNRPGAGLYLPALTLLLLIVADATLTHFNGQSLLTLPYSILAFGAAALLTVPAAIRYLRH